MPPLRFHPASPIHGPHGGPGDPSIPPPAQPPPAPPVAPTPSATPPFPPPGGRLNLLLTCASWRDDSWADRLPQLLEPLGIHSVRARSGREAERTIRTVQVHIAVVDLGLPLEHTKDPQSASEAGTRILELLRRLEAPPPTVVVKGSRPIRDDARHLAAALRFDAFAVVDRSADIELMLKIFQRCLTRYYQDRWPTPPNVG